MVTATEIEAIVRRVVREELAAMMGTMQHLQPVSAPQPMIDPGSLPSPFLLNERELCQAEALLPEEERPILRTRVYAARLEKMGNSAQASKFRRKADRMEQQLEARLKGRNRKES